MTLVVHRTPIRLAVGILAMTACTPPPPVTAPSEVAPTRAAAASKAPVRVDFEVTAVDDREDFIAHLDESTLPEGFAVHWENAADGPGRWTKTYFVQVSAAPHESPDAVFVRAERWSSARALSAKKRIVWQEIEDEDTEASRARFVGVRSYVVGGDRILSNADVVKAVVQMPNASSLGEAYVAIELAPAAAERFADATDALRQRRIAIIVGGRVMSVPVVKSRIAGGRLSLTVGADVENAHETQVDRARALAKALGGHE